MEADLARALAGITNGIYVLTVAEGGHVHGMSSSWVTQVSGAPPLIMAAIDNSHRTREMVVRAGAFGLNVVGRRGRALEDYFFSARARRPDNLDAVEYELSPRLKVPWLKLAALALEARVVASHVAGDHTMFLGEPADVSIRAGDRPLTSLDLDYVYIGGGDVVARDRTGWD